MTGSKFDGAAVVARLEYDLTTWRPDPDAPGLDDAERERRRQLAGQAWTGVIPEPDDDLITWFFQGELPDIRLEQLEATDILIRGQRDARRARWLEEHPGQEPPTDTDLDALEQTAVDMRAEQSAYLDVVEKARKVGRERTVRALARFCGDSPPADVLEALPWRAFTHFLGWLTGQFRPETLAAAMNS